MKRYFIWKDANCNGINPEWKEITGSEYFALVKTEPQRRLMPFDKDGDYCEDDFWYEVTNEVYIHFRCELSGLEYKPIVKLSLGGKDITGLFRTM